MSSKNLSAQIGIVGASFNRRIHRRLKEGTLDELKKVGVNNYKYLEVPGVVEIPLAVQWLFQQTNCQVVIVLGCVIRGETDHFKSCCRMVEQGCMSIQLKVNRPVIFGVLMTHNESQALERSGGLKGHVGRVAVHTALQMLQIQKELKSH